jgi:DNA polymerase III psi subunit
VLSKPWKDIEADERILLQKILSAVGLSLEAVIIKYQPVFNLAEWPSKPLRALYFGPFAKGLPQNEVIVLEESSVIVSSQLSELQADAGGKQKLWQALKSLFNA